MTEKKKKKRTKNKGDLSHKFSIVAGLRFIRAGEYQ